MSVALWMAVKPLYMHSQWHYWGIDSEWSELLLDHLSLQELLKQKALWLKTLRGCLKTIVNGSEFSESNDDSSNHKHLIC